MTNDEAIRRAAERVAEEWNIPGEYEQVFRTDEEVEVTGAELVARIISEKLDEVEPEAAPDLEEVAREIASNFNQFSPVLKNQHKVEQKKLEADILPILRKLQPTPEPMKLTQEDLEEDPDGEVIKLLEPTKVEGDVGRIVESLMCFYAFLDINPVAPLFTELPKAAAKALESLSAKNEELERQIKERQRHKIKSLMGSYDEDDVENQLNRMKKINGELDNKK